MLKPIKINHLKASTLKFVFFIGTSITLVACGGGGGSDESNGNADDNAPTATFTPANTATDVETSTNVNATFSKDMIASSIDATSFTLSDSNGAIAATVSFDANTNIATLNPSTALGLQKTYTSQLNEEISDLSGNALANTSTQFTTRDGAWNGPALLIDGGSGANFQNAQIIVSPNGNAVAVYAEIDNVHSGSINNIYANYYTVAEGWSGKVSINNQNRSPDIFQNFEIVIDAVIDADGNATVVWAEYSIPDSAFIRSSIFANRYTVGSGWRTALLIEADFAGNAFAPKLGVDTKGDVTAAWEQVDESQHIIWRNHFSYSDASNTWGTAIKVSTDTADSSTNTHSGLDVAIAPDGARIITWQWLQGSSYFSHYFYTSNDEPDGSISRITFGNHSVARDQKVEFDSNGNAIAVWQQYDDSSNTISSLYSKFFEASTLEWGPTTLVETDNAFSVSTHDLAVDPSGKYMVVWAQNNSIWANYYSKFIGSWDGAQTIENNINNTTSAPKVAMTDINKFTAIWSQINNSGNIDVYTNSFTPSGWTTTEMIESSPGNTTSPDIGIDSNGRKIAVWVQENSGRNAITSRSFN